MFCISPNNKIVLTKGDTATIKVAVVDLDGEEYVIQDDDVITMTVKKNAAQQTASITKTANEQHIIVIFPSDTSSLDTGLYLYDVQLETSAGNVYTIVPQSFFDLLEEIG